MVDDNRSMNKLTVEFLETIASDLKLRTTTSAKQALKMVAASQFDVIVSDLKMPKMDGLEFLRALREKDMITPFIVFTGHGGELTAIQALNDGADFYVVKGGQPSVKYAELVRQIRKAIELGRARSVGRERIPEEHRWTEGTTTSTWVEDFSAVKSFVDKLARKGVVNLREYFKENEDELRACLNLIKTYSIAEAKRGRSRMNTYAEPYSVLENVFGVDTLGPMGDVISCLADGETRIFMEITSKPKSAKKVRLLFSAVIAPGCDENWNQICMTFQDMRKNKKRTRSRRG